MIKSELIFKGKETYYIVITHGGMNQCARLPVRILYPWSFLTLRYSFLPELALI
jgi:hypothetical protein